MFRSQRRIIKPELLDWQEAERAAPSLGDLRRINRLLGGHRVLREALARVAKPAERFSLLDVGAASGDSGAEVRRHWPQARVISLDYRIDHLAEAAPPKLVADAFQLPFAPATIDIVFCSLFLHHFEDQAVVELLHSFRRVARRAVVVSDLERRLAPYLFLPCTRWLFHWDAITLHDGPISVQAGFHAQELRALASRAGWQQVEVRTHRPAFRLSLVGA